MESVGHMSLRLIVFTFFPVVAQDAVRHSVKNMTRNFFILENESEGYGNFIGKDKEFAALVCDTPADGA